MLYINGQKQKKVLGCIKGLSNITRAILGFAVLLLDSLWGLGVFKYLSLSKYFLYKWLIIQFRKHYKYSILDWSFHGKKGKWFPWQSCSIIAISCLLSVVLVVQVVLIHGGTSFRPTEPTCGRSAYCTASTLFVVHKEDFIWFNCWLSMMQLY